MKKQSQLGFNLTAGVSLVIFLMLAYGVLFHQTWIHTFDQYFGHAVRRFISPGLSTFMIHFTKFGNFTSLLGFTVGAGLILFLVRRIKAALFLLINGVLLAGPVNVLVKHFINRPRPTLPHMVTVHSSSFPSGHSMSIMLVAGSLILIANRLLKNATTKLIVGILLAIIILGIGISRIYVGVHFASDVLGGWSLGFVTLAISRYCFNRFGGGIA
ncbi:undecaprenyl pyrophosphate phosphatase [Lentilactobacillus parabuchneri]|jgi:undecaprenyl-diphosphatase|nr:phosphatase PAP2 family protein [Lentilactobacillus parabuchneri]APR08249.1 undecaprenyl pyrophosphate phosphatase [Lentilactobacillus parabuchneri]MBW0222506.1 phosphatase PAP2 family protein [Lentilactobacillus parabuchneri]MBW0244691.1 phosphatase PAP2 family protein [Lentilactobacillus parabuchneri]MBW0262769.1 phosphatase PAP2 family protein [Lentilactobacillus parabuchneri]MCT2885761.1 phosphatase PAP2 family protein [Lentilactobacillus parabuchneri]